jgi:hypothetical protein
MVRGIPWYYNDSVSQKDVDDGFYFTHIFYNDHQPMSGLYTSIVPILNKISVKACIRVKGNLYLNVGRQVENGWHVDNDYPHKGAVYYVNTNNGYTEMEDGTKIESVENRILLFAPLVKHRSVQCTDKKYRFTINVNYF